MEVDFSGSYVNADNSKDKDIAEIIGEGTQETKKSVKGNEYTATTIPIKLNGKQLLMDLSMNTGKSFVKAWNKETKNWIGKKIQIHHVNYLSYGQTKVKIEATPIEAIKV